ncbi:MAG: DUF2851 family protein [Chitinophagales bacterium]
MTEKLLQFIWKHRYFNQQELSLLSGETLYIDYPGDENNNQGPDFINARIRINGTHWAGSVELHLVTSGWDKHGHDQDEHYRNVILHVVWEQDRAQMTRNIPQLELCQRVSGIMLDTYAGWMDQFAFVPCERSLKKTVMESLAYWQPALLIKRLDRRMLPILHSLELNHFHWEEQLWWMMAGNFGMKVNAAVFESMARSIPFMLLAKHRQQRIQLEALLFGQANLLEENFRESYPVMLKKEFQFLKAKYRLGKVFEQVHFLRMRPENFPTIRLSQLASLYSESTNLFTWVMQCEGLTELRKKFMLTANDYWFYHYVFDKESRFKVKSLGKGTVENLIINTIIPLLYAYGKIHPDKPSCQKALRWMQEIPAEQNEILSRWKQLGMKIRSAAGSQALLELKNEFCQQKKCLECDIGNHLLRSSGKNTGDQTGTATQI